jgi:hypothetical protein
MLTFVIAVGAVMLPVIFGGLLAFGVSRLDSVVTDSKEEVENRDKGYNPTLTLGHKIKMGLEPDEQLQQARVLAAKKAASIPRGANMRIGRLGKPTLKPASKGLQDDPWTSVKIARYHGWDGAKLGTAAAAQSVAGAAAGGAAVAARSGKIELVPGKDYEHIEITAGMAGAEKRQARIANAKAKSRAYKAAKTAREGAGAMPVAAAAAAPAAAGQPAAAPAAAVPTGIPEPNYIEITDNMVPDDVRKARIQNSKEKSRYNKALKAAGFDPQAVEAGEVVVPAAVAAPAAQPTAAPAAAVPTGIPEPNYIEITDDMAPDDVRKARIQNSKEKSKYNKALKAAGFDPQAVEAGEVAAPAAAPPQPVAAAPATASTAVPAAASGPDPAALAAIPEPNYIEITDDMAPDDIRQARIQNSKARSAYNKALKAAGIDPKSVD